MCKKIFKWVFWILTVLIMVMIFLFSAQEAVKSQKTSESFTKKVLSVSKNFKELPEIKQNMVVEKVQFSVRKAAHFSVYTLLGISLLSAMQLSFKKRFLWLYSYVIATFYAVTDEFHQLFVIGRSCRVGDMFIDSMGALSGILIVLIITTLYKNKKAKR